MVINIKVHNEAVAAVRCSFRSLLPSRSIAPAAWIHVCECEWVCLHIKWLPCEAAGQLMELHIWALLAWENEPQKQNETMGKDLEQAEIVEDICKYIITYCPAQN